jgi:hypothetical protein
MGEAMAEVTDARHTYLSSYREFARSAAGGRHPWLRQLREDAAARFERAGFPTTRHEGWRHTNLAPVAKVPFAPAVQNPEPEGINTTTLLDLVCALCDKRVVGFDVLEVAPMYDQGVSAVVAAKVMFEMLCQLEKSRKT